MTYTPPTIIPNSEWEDDIETPQHFDLPAEYNILHHTVTPIDWGEKGQWLDDAEFLDDIGERRGFRDISYSFLVAIIGLLIEARGLGVVGAHTKGHNSRAHALAAIGNYEIHKPSAAMLESIAQWHAWMIIKGHTKRGPLRYHKQLDPRTQCCGKHLIAAIPAINARANNIIDNHETGNMTTTIPTEKNQIKEIQRWLIASDYDLGTFGPEGDGVDGDWGNLTQIAWDAYTQPLAHLGRIAEIEDELDDKTVELAETLVELDEANAEITEIERLAAEAATRAKTALDETQQQLNDLAGENDRTIGILKAELIAETAKTGDALRSNTELRSELVAMQDDVANLTLELDGVRNETDNNERAAGILREWQQANVNVIQWHPTP